MNPFGLWLPKEVVKILQDHCLRNHTVHRVDRHPAGSWPTRGDGYDGELVGVLLGHGLLEVQDMMESRWEFCCMVTAYQRCRI